MASILSRKVKYHSGLQGPLQSSPLPLPHNRRSLRGHQVVFFFAGPQTCRAVPTSGPLRLPDTFVVPLLRVDIQVSPQQGSPLHPPPSPCVLHHPSLLSFPHKSKTSTVCHTLYCLSFVIVRFLGCNLVKVEILVCFVPCCVYGEGNPLGDDC